MPVGCPKPPCRESNPGHRPMAFPVRTRWTVVWSRHDTACVALHCRYRQSALSMRPWETCRLSSRLQGVGRLSGARPCPWPELAAASIRVSAPRLRGAHHPVRQHAACVHSPAKDSGIAAGCENSAARAYASPCLVKFVSAAPFEPAIGFTCSGEVYRVFRIWQAILRIGHSDSPTSKWPFTSTEGMTIRRRSDRPGPHGCQR